MKKLINSFLVASTIACSPALQAQQSTLIEQESQAPSNTIPSEEAVTAEAVSSDNEENEGTPVGQAANEGLKTAKRKQWQNIALATVAVAVVVTALILVADNDGHRKSD
jgi:hypothetical protein